MPTVMIIRKPGLTIIFNKDFHIFAGAHTLSGACLEPRALDELFPDWAERGVR